MATYVDLSTLHTPTPRSSPPASWGAQIRENFEWAQQNRRQICTSSTRPVGFEGLEIYETDTNLVYIHDGSDWREVARLAAAATYSPTVTQSGSVTKTNTVALVHKSGRFTTVHLLLAITGSGTGANIITVSTPSTSQFASDVTVGYGSIFDVSGPNVAYPARVVMHSTTTVAFSPTHVTTGGFYGTSTFTAALASGDSIDCSFSYLATS